MDATMSRPFNSLNTHDDVLAQLTEMFCDCIPLPTITKIAQEQNWELSNCIENLIRYNNENDVGVNEDSEDADILIESEELQQPSTPPRAIEPNQSQGMTAKYTGAIRKTSATSSNTYAWPASPSNKFQSDAGNSKSNSQSTGHFNYSQQQNQKPSFSSFMQNGSANQFADHSTGTPYNNRRRNDEIPDHPQYRAVVSDIRQGHRVLVIMRGAPGCGKSHLARRIVDETVNGDYESHIFSTDDFFYDKKKDRYVYNRDFLEPAHNANQSKVTQRALNGWSPIIVDNTNIRLWEMVPYLREGVNNGYLIHILEPNTPWARSSGKLAMRNKHGVPRNKIEQMLANYEMATVEQCLAIYKLVYSIPVPIQRNYPSMVNYTTNTTIVPNNNNANPRNASNATHEPRSQRKRRPQQPTTQTMPLILANVVENNESDTFQWAAEHLQSLNNRWAAFDPEQNAQSWNTTSAPMPVRSINTAPLPQRSEPKIQSNGIYDLLRNLTDVLNVESTPIKTDDQTTEEKIQLEKHEKECPNENDSFRQIRQIYPDRAISYLWDLFEKCNGDGNWTMDILLKDEDTTNTNQLLTEESRRQDNFTCSCRTGPVHNTFQDAVNAIPTALLAESAQLPPSVTLNTKSTRRDRVETQIESEIRRQIEEQFAINDEQDSVHVRKLRDFRRGIQSGEATSSTPKPIEASVEEMVADGDDGMSDGDELIDVDLGVELVCQLDRVFGSDAFQRDHLKDMKTTVFMPRALGQQLYAIWMESLYNQIEEQRQKSIKEDEEFAKQLHLKEKYPKIMQENQPNNLKDIMEMEYAWKAYQTDVDDWKKTTPQDLASKMTRAKLFEIFPNVNRDTLVEVLAAHGNKFDNTVEVLKESLGSDINDKMAVESQRLLKEVRNETQAIGPSVDEAGSSRRAIRALEAKKLGPEEAKRAALHDFEENRNMAMHHHQLKAECYAKAKEAFQRRDGQVAFYYTNVANLHKNKIDLYNHKAANAIVEVHSYTQKNPDMLDLHYLHSDEAIECLDIFLDKQILLARTMQRNFKYVFVITGRGLHSAGGFATIKHKVKSRLKERSLSWAEVNPGLLKVRLQGFSVFTKDV